MGTPNAKAAERKRVLQERKRERQAQLQLQLDEWFERFDEDHNKQLDRNELRKLLMHLHPDTPVAEEALDYLIKRATEIVSASLTLEGNANGMIPRDKAVKTVTRYSQYLKDKRELDEKLKQFDSDGNGKLEPEELAALLRDMSPGVEVTDNDAEFVLENCDRDQDGSISPDELMNTVALWKMLLSQQPVRKRYLAKQTSILARGRSALMGDAAGAQPRPRTVQFLPPLPPHVIPPLPQGSARSGSWRQLPPSRRSIDPLDQAGRSLRETGSSGFGASAQDPHGPPGGGPTELPIETHTMGMVDEKLRDEAIAKVRSSLCAIL